MPTNLVLDVETTTSNKGNCYDDSNRLVCISYLLSDSSLGTSYGAVDTHTRFLIDDLIAESSLIIGFNFKFDLAWLHKWGCSFKKKQIWDVQIAEFILSHQTNRFPSLDGVCEKYGLGSKLDVVKTEYWDKGIDTDEIPWEVLSEYAIKDVELTHQCYLRQQEEMTPAQKKLCYLMCQDLVVLQEMESTGIYFDEALCKERSIEVSKRVLELQTELQATYPSVPINFGSNDHLSAFLYGGIVKEDAKEHVGFFKSGVKAGQPKYKNIVIEHTLPRLYTPLKGSEMAKVGNFSVDEASLRKLKGKSSVINNLLELSKLEKLNGTYYNGLVKLRKEMNWEENTLHGNFNQTTAQTGRLSSSRPNLQNFATDLQDIFISRYDD